MRNSLIKPLLFSNLLPTLLANLFERPTEQLTFQPLQASTAEQYGMPSRLVSLSELVSRTPILSNVDILLFNHHIRTHPEKRLVRWADGHQEWVTEGQKSLLVFNEAGRKFVDVTGWTEDGFVLDSDADRRRLIAEQADVNSSTFPTQIKFGTQQLDYLIRDIQTARMRTRLSEFSRFRTRYYHSATGRQSQAWLLQIIRDLASRSSSNVTVTEFKHKWGQHSIIARIEPHPDSATFEDASTFIIGAHQDSTNLLPFLAAPGADDDGSGTTAVLEAFEVLLGHGWTPAPGQGAVEFMWFSAEEGGLLGSQEVARAYRDAGRTISGMIQLDMTAFVKAGTQPAVGLVTDFVDPSLTQYLRLIIDEYLSIGWVNTKCGYACSDHASWTNINVPSAFAIESTFENSNHKIHSTSDTIDVPGFSFEHMAEFSKLVIGAIVELAGQR